MNDKLYRILAITIPSIVLAISIFFGMRLLDTGDGAWICSSDGWIKYGRPSSPMPETDCGVGGSQRSAEKGMILEYAKNSLKIRSGSGEERFYNIGKSISVKRGNLAVDPNYLHTGLEVEVFSSLLNGHIYLADAIAITDEPNIAVLDPAPGQYIKAPISINGLAKVPGGSLRYRITDASGKVLDENKIQTDGLDDKQHSNFRAVSTITDTDGVTSGSVEVYYYSPKDGSEADKVSIPVFFGTAPISQASVQQTLIKDAATATQTKDIEQPLLEKTPSSPSIFVKSDPPESPYTSPTPPTGTTINEKVFFIKQTGSDCGEATAISRKMAFAMKHMIRASLESLFEGPTDEEKKNGYSTAIPAGVYIKDMGWIDQQGGTFYVDFSKELTAGVTDQCQKTSIKSQIIKTISEFPIVKKLRLTVEGAQDPILQ